MEYRRNLPHFQPAGAAIFITFRVRGRHLLWLAEPRVAECVTAECVTEVIRDGERLRAFYLLVAFVVMPNHVHFLIEPSVPSRRSCNLSKALFECLGTMNRPVKNQG